MQTDALVGIQDMGAAGLTCSTTEMGSRGGAGVEIDVSLVPQRETGMTPYEIMLSESQERMLLVVKRGREAEVERIFEKWDLHAVRIGEVTDDGMLRVQGARRRRRRDSEPRADRRSAGLPAADERAGVSATRSQQLDLDDCSLRALARPRATQPDVRRCCCAARLADHRQQALGLPAVRPHGADQHGQPARPRRRRRAHQGHRSRAGDVGRRQRPLLLPRSVSRRDARGRRGGAQRRLRRRAAARRDQLPELRQPGAAGDHVAVREGGRRHRRRVPRAGRADHRRQRQPVQRDRRQGDLSDAGHRRRRPARARRSRRRAAGSRSRATRSCCSARAAASSAAAST